MKLPTGSTYSIELDPLAHKIIPKESTFKVLSTKIEIKLKKEICGIMWGALESDNDLGSKFKYVYKYMYLKLTSPIFFM